MSMLQKIWLLTLVLFSTNLWAKLDIQTWQSQKGTKVMYVHAPQLPMVDIEITFDAGSARDGDHWGVASFTATMLGTATPRMDEDEINEIFNSVGARLNTDIGRDQLKVSIRSLTRPQILEKTLDTFEQTLSQAIFKQEIFDREMALLKLALKQSAVKPQTLGSKKLWATLYGDHPYAHPPMGTLESAEKLSLQHVKDFYKKHYVAKNAVIAIVGNVDRAQAEAIANQLMANLPSGQKMPAIPSPEPLKQAQKELIEFDSTQTYYSLSQMGIERGHPDYAALFLGNHMFGGSGFGSLLMEEVREKRGLVYSVYSYFAPMRVAGPFIIGLSTKNASAMEADKVVRETLTNFMNDFSDEKLQAIKDNLIGGFPMRIDSNSKILDYISMIGFYNLPLDYLEWFPKQIEQTTKQDVLNAWQKHVHPDKMLTIMVGRPS